MDLSSRFVWQDNLDSWENQEELRKMLTPDFTMQEYLQDFYAVNPAPGIDAVPDARVIRAENRDGDCIAHVEMSLESYVRLAVQYDEDPLKLLQKVKETAGEEAAKIAAEFMQDEDADFSVAMINCSCSDQWPTTPQL